MTSANSEIRQAIITEVTPTDTFLTYVETQPDPQESHGRINVILPGRIAEWKSTSRSEEPVVRKVKTSFLSPAGLAEDNLRVEIVDTLDVTTGQITKVGAIRRQGNAQDENSTESVIRQLKGYGHIEDADEEAVLVSVMDTDGNKQGYHTFTPDDWNKASFEPQEWLEVTVTQLARPNIASFRTEFKGMGTDKPEFIIRAERADEEAYQRARRGMTPEFLAKVKAVFGSTKDQH